LSSCKLLRLTASESLADELLQETFITLWEKRQQIIPELSIKSWLYKVAVNNVYLTYRKIAIDKKLQEHLIVNFAEAYSHIEEAIYLTENKEILYKAIDQLSPQRREVFTLCKLDGKSYDEVAGILGISSNTVSSHMVKATQAIRQYLFQSKESIALIIMSLTFYDVPHLHHLMSHL